LAKETAVALPIVFTAFVWATRSETSDAPGPTSAPTLKRLWAHWIPATLLYLGVRAMLVPSQGVGVADRMQILLHKLAVLPSSIGKLFLPLHLAVMPTASDATEWREIIPGILAVGIVLALLRADGVRRRFILLAVCLILVPLVPSLMTLDQLILENRLYLPAVGSSLVFAEALQFLLPKMAWLRLTGPALAALGFAATYSYQGALRDRGTFARAAVETSPNLALAHLQMGTYAQQEMSDLDAAEKEYRRAIELNPKEHLVHNNLGVLLMNRKKWSEAKAEFLLELRYFPTEDKAHYNLGLVLRREGAMQDAVAEWKEALVHNPNHIDAMGELMTYYSQRGQQAEAAYYAKQLQSHGLQLVSPDGKPLDKPK
jgi:tetratricopeptide (TPR) repeat protein